MRRRLTAGHACPSLPLIYTLLPCPFCGTRHRTGMCKDHARGRCAFIHDPALVAVCPRWLQGACDKGAQCPLQHKVRVRVRARSECRVHSGTRETAPWRAVPSGIKGPRAPSCVCVLPPGQEEARGVREKLHACKCMDRKGCGAYQRRCRARHGDRYRRWVHGVTRRCRTLS